MSGYFKNLKIAEFWDNDEYAFREYVGRPISDEMVKAAESVLGYKLPQSYVEFLKIQNGGVPKNTNHRTKEPTSWSEDHIAITGIYGIDPEKSNSLTGDLGSRFWMSEWGYPDIGVYFADCPSAGHDMLCLDYRANPEHPQVVHVDQEGDYKITFVAPSFEAFIARLESDEAFE